MKVTEFSIIPYSVSIVTPLNTSKGKYSHRDGLIIKITTDEFSGYGEAAPLPGFSKEGLKETAYAIESFHQAIIGNGEASIEELLRIVSVYAEGNPSAIFGIETAILNLASAMKNQNLSTYLSLDSLKSVVANGISGIHTPVENYSTIKVKVGFRNLWDEIENMKNLTAEYGNKISFRLDANGQLDLPKAIRLCKELERFNIEYMEQPLPANQLEDLAELRFHTEIPIAVDESLTDINSAKLIIEEQAADVFVIKPMLTGRIKDCEIIINMARENNINPIITSTLETVVGTNTCIQIAAANQIESPCGFALGLVDSESFYKEAGLSALYNQLSTEILAMTRYA